MKIRNTKPYIPHKALRLKTNTKTYLLLAAVLGIWGTIGYKVITGVSDDDPEVQAVVSDATFNPKPQQEQDTFSVALAERDPFLGTLAAKKKKTSKSNTVKTQQITIDDPTVTFGGVVKKQGSSQQVFVVNINNQQYLLKKGQKMDGVTLVSGNSKSITVRFNGKTQKIPIQ